tara:strand:+ start:4870 stop:5073 length:204 start_codon:yes stop_codon:yes gene_type:complete
MPNIYLTDPQVEQVYRVCKTELTELDSTRASPQEADILAQVVDKLTSAQYDANYRRRQINKPTTPSK